MEIDPVTRSAVRHVEIAGWKLDRRSHFLAPGWDQKRALIQVACITLIFFGASIALFYWMLQQVSAPALESAPELSAIIRGQDRQQLMLMIAGSAVAWLGVLLFASRETHRTAGPLHNLVMRMDEMAAAGPSVRVHFRKHDHFRHVAVAFNEMAESLENRNVVTARGMAEAAAALREAAGALVVSDPASRVAVETVNRAVADLERLRDDLIGR